MIPVSILLGSSPIVLGLARSTYQSIEAEPLTYDQAEVAQLRPYPVPSALADLAPSLGGSQ